MDIKDLSVIVLDTDNGIVFGCRLKLLEIKTFRFDKTRRKIITKYTKKGFKLHSYIKWFKKFT